jgi:hypothetical protein
MDLVAKWCWLLKILSSLMLDLDLKVLPQMVMIFELCAVKIVSSSVMILSELLNGCVFW